MKNKKDIGLIFGGISPEHQISIESSKTIFNSYINEKENWEYNIRPYYVDKDGFWHNPCYSEKILTETPLSERDDMKKSEIPFSYENIDLWLPMIHGKYGEDGTIHSFLKPTNLPIAGTDSKNSKKCFDKILSRKIAASKNIKQPPFFYFDSDSSKTKTDFIRDNILFPVFVKPSGTGSSIGITKVNSSDELYRAIKTAKKIDKNILVEQGIKNCIELEIAIIGQEENIMSDIGTISYTDAFYTNNAKYNDQTTKILIPADIKTQTRREIIKISKKLFKLFGIRDFCRIDFFYDTENDQLYWNEINTVPGFTDKSMFPLLWKNKGLELNKVIEHIVKKVFK